MSAIGQQDVRTFLASCDATDGWQQVASAANYTEWSRPGAASLLSLKIAYTIAGVTPQQVVETLADQEYRRTWDTNALRRDVVRKIDASNTLIYYQYNVPYVTNRDYVFVQTTWRDGETFVLLNQSVDDPAYPPNANGLVRAYFHATGFVIRPAEGGTLVVNVACNDMGGSIPSFLINSQAKNVLPKNLAIIEKAARGYDAWKQQHSPEDRPWLTFAPPA